MIQQLRQGGTAVLLVEQLIDKALALADRVYALARGSIVLEANASEADLPHRLEQVYMMSVGPWTGLTRIRRVPCLLESKSVASRYTASSSRKVHFLDALQFVPAISTRTA